MDGSLEILVVGQGLAGSLLAWELIDRAVSFRIVEGDLPHAAHAASAGMINPVAGPRRNRPWGWDSYFPTAAARYRELARRLDAELLHDLDLLACLRDAEDRDRTLPRLEAGEHADHVTGLHPPGTFSPAIADEFGSYSLRGALRFDVREFVLLSREEFRRRGLLVETTFGARDLDRDENLGAGGPLYWRDLVTRHLVLATGHRAATSRWFADLPWRISRGETIDIALDAEADAWPHSAVNRKEWLLRLAPDRARVGAVYDGRAPEAGPTPGGRDQLLAAAARLGAAGRPLLDHRAGARAGGIDWRPYVGHAREDARIWLLGGLGSKGALYAPGLATRLAVHLLEGLPLDPEIDLARRR